MATAYDTAGVVVPDVRVRWLSFDTTIAVVDSTGHARLGPVTSSVSVSATDSASSAADTIILHVAREGEVRWVLNLADSTSTVGGPTLGPDGTVYLLTAPFYGTQNVADLHAVSPRGTERWRLRLDRTLENGLVVGPDGTVYVIGRTVRAVTPTGAVSWAQVLTAASTSAFLMGALAPGGPLIVAGENSPLSLDLTTGDTVWVGPVDPFGGWLLPPTVAGPTVWIKRTADTLYSLALATGQVQLGIADPDTGLDKRSFGMGPVVVGDRLYMPTAYRLAAFDTSGQLLWLTQDRGTGVTEPVIDAQGNVYVQTNADGLLALEPTAGAWRWRRLACRPRWTWHGGPALGEGGVIYCAALNGFYAYDTSGTLRWAYQTTEGGTDTVPFYGAPAIAPDGTVYSYSDSRLYGFWGSHPPEPNSPWAMWRHDAQRTGVAR